MNINYELYTNIYDLYKPTFTIPYRIKLKLIFGKTWLGKTKSKDILEEYFQRPQKLKTGLDKKWPRIQCLYFQGFLQTVRLLRSRCWVLLQKRAMFGQQPWEEEKQLTPSWPWRNSAAGLLPLHPPPAAAWISKAAGSLLTNDLQPWRFFSQPLLKCEFLRETWKPP